MTETSANNGVDYLKFLAVSVIISLLFLIQTVSAEELNFTADDASKEEIATQTFHIDGYRRIYTSIPIDKYDFARIEVELKLTKEVSGTGFFVMDSRYTQQTGLSNHLDFCQQPSEFEKRRIEFQINGKGEIKVEKAEAIKITPDYRFDGEYYNIYLFIKSSDANQGFKGDMKVYSKKSFNTLSYTLKLSYFGREIFRDSKSLTSKNKFAKGKLSDIELNIPARFFILPGTYNLEITSNGWKFSKSFTVWPGISSIVAFALVALTVYAGVRYRREIREWLDSLSIGQKLVLIAIILLIFSALILAFENKRSANSTSILAYYFLVLGVGNLTAEYMLERRNEGSKENSIQEAKKKNKESKKGEDTKDEVFDPYPEVRSIISLMVLSILLHFTPEVLRTFPYLDVAAFISVIFLVVLSVKERKIR